MVTGKLPFEADSAVTIALKHIQEEPVPPKSLNSRIPDSLNTLILKAIEKDPNKRYQTAKEFINDLQKIKDNPNAVIDEVVDDSNPVSYTHLNKRGFGYTKVWMHKLTCITLTYVSRSCTVKLGHNKWRKSFRKYYYANGCGARYWRYVT